MSGQSFANGAGRDDRAQTPEAESFIVEARPWSEREKMLFEAHEDASRDGGLTRLDGGPLRIFELEQDLYHVLQRESLSVRDKRVLVCPGYGSLPHLLARNGADFVVGLEKDPYTYALQQARLWFGEDANGEDFITVPRKFTGSRCGERLRQLVTRVRTGHVNSTPQDANLAFVEHDVLHPLPRARGRGYNLILVPYLLGLARGIKNAADIEFALDNLCHVLDPGGQMLILPSSVAAAGGPIDLSPQLQQVAAKRGLSVKHSDAIRLYNFEYGADGNYALLSAP